MNGKHELFLMTDDLDGEIAALEADVVQCETPTQQSWGPGDWTR